MKEYTPEELELHIEVLRAALLQLCHANETRCEIPHYLENAWKALDWSPDDNLSTEDTETARKKAELKAAKHDIHRLIDSIASRAVNHVPISPIRMMRILGRLRKWLADPERHWYGHGKVSFYELTQEANDALNEFHHAAYQAGVVDWDIPF